MKNGEMLSRVRILRRFCFCDVLCMVRSWGWRLTVIVYLWYTSTGRLSQGMFASENTQAGDQPLFPLPLRSNFSCGIHVMYELFDLLLSIVQKWVSKHTIKPKMNL